MANFDFEKEFLLYFVSSVTTINLVFCAIALFFNPYLFQFLFFILILSFSISLILSLYEKLKGDKNGRNKRM